MEINTKFFGTVEIGEEKVLCFEHGIAGFEDLREFVILYDNNEGESTISWLQSLEEVGVALPVMDPFLLFPDFNPMIEDELLKPLGEPGDNGLYVMLVMNVPADLTQMTVNQRAPLVINADTRKGCQVILEDNSYQVRYNIYDKFLCHKERSGE